MHINSKVLASCISLLTVYCVQSHAASDTQQLESKFGLSPQEAQQISGTGRVEDFAKVKEMGVTAQEFMQGVEQKLTAQQMITRHQHPCYDRLKSVTQSDAPTTHDLAAGDCLIEQGNKEFNKEHLQAARYLIQAPKPTADEIAAVSYLMNTKPALIKNPAEPTKEEIAATAYLMQTSPSAIKNPKKPTANQIAATVRLQGALFQIAQPSAQEIQTGDHLISIKMPDFTSQEFGTAFYMMNTLKPVIAKPTMEQISAMMQLQSPPFNIALPTSPEIENGTQLIALGAHNFTPTQVSALNYLVNTAKIKKPTPAQVDATLLLQTPQHGVSVIKEPTLAQIDAVTSGNTPEIKQEIAWALQNKFNGKEPGDFPGGVAKVVSTQDGPAHVHDFEIVWTDPGRDAFHSPHISVDAVHFPKEAFSNLKQGDLVIFADLGHDPEDDTKVVFTNAAQHH